MINQLKERYTPLYYLASLGAGGLAVSFFIYLMFMIPHPKTPMITADVLFPMIAEGTLASALIVLCYAGVLYFAFLHFRLLIWNIKEYNLFKATEAYEQLKRSNAEVSLMAMPLTYAMTINVFFVLGALLVPGLWSIIEYMFPFALLGFAGVGLYGLKLFSHYFSRILIAGDFDFAANNNLSQMIAIFAFAMVAVGFAAPGAMSSYKEVSAIGMFCSIFFLAIAVSLVFVKLILGLKSILKQGISKEASVSLWIMIPILTLIGITAIRLTFGFAHNFYHGHPSTTWLFVLTSAIVSLQIMFGLVGYMVMKKIGYFDEFIHGDTKSPSSYAIICPGVAFFVFGVFFLTFGLVKNGVIGLLSPFYLVLLAPFVYVQIRTILVLLKLNSKMLFIDNK